MIAPQTRLLFWVTVIFLPFSVLGAALPEFLPVAVLFIATLLLLAVLDAALGLGSLKGIEVKLPEVLRLSKDRTGKIELHIRNQSQNHRRLRVGLAFPRTVHSPHEELDVALPGGSEWSRLEWACTPSGRGNYLLERVYLEGSSRMGFWSIRASRPAHLELRVYPNLLTERKSLAALFLNRGTFGLHAQRQIGKGRDFEKLREYIPGDSYDEIHWKATAKRGHPVSKVFQIERTQEVYVILDSSRLSERALPPSLGSRFPSLAGGPTSPAGLKSKPRTQPPVPSEETTLERYITAALVLGLAAEQQGDLFGVLTFSDRIGSFIRAKNGQAHYNACRDALYTLEPRPVTPDFEEMAAFIRSRLRRRALLIFLTALDDPVLMEGFTRNMDLLCRQHLIVVNMMRPEGAAPLFTQPDAGSLDDLYRHLGGHFRWQKLRELEKVLRRRGVQFSLLGNERMSAELVSQYLGVKRRQIL